MAIHLKVVEGKQRGQFLNFPSGEFVFGRGPECHVRPNSDLISRQHCLLRVDKRGAFLQDLGSTNGTLVNGHRILEEFPLHVGDLLALGPLVLQVVSTDQTECQGLISTLNSNPAKATDETVDTTDPIVPDPQRSASK